MEEKAVLRGRMRERLKRITPDERAEASARAAALLRRQTVWLEARSILFYAPLRNELDLTPLLEEALAAGKMAALPRFDPETNIYRPCQVLDPARLPPGQFGVLEPEGTCPPVPLNRLDLALVPGLGFDLAGRRLGRGQGYYDRLLAGITGIKCGVAFDSQVEAEVPFEPHDIWLNCLLTPEAWFNFDPPAEWR